MGGSMLIDLGFQLLPFLPRRAFGCPRGDLQLLPELESREFVLCEAAVASNAPPGRAGHVQMDGEQTGALLQWNRLASLVLTET